MTTNKQIGFDEGFRLLMSEAHKSAASAESDVGRVYWPLFLALIPAFVAHQKTWLPRVEAGDYTEAVARMCAWMISQVVLSLRVNGAEMPDDAVCGAFTKVLRAQLEGADVLAVSELRRMDA